MSYKVLDPLDSAFVTLEVPGAPLHIGVIIEMDVPDDGLDSKQRFEVLRANIAARLHEIPVLTKRVLRTPFDLAWPVLAEDPDFDINAHVIRRAVTSPGGEEQLDALVARVMSRELAPDRPLWELNYIEGLADGRAAIVMKVHHALADGVSGAATFAGLFDLSPEVRQPEPPQNVPAPDPLPTPLELLGRTGSELLKRPAALLEVLGAALERAADLVEGAAESLAGREDESHQPSIFQAKTTSINGTPGYAKQFKRLRVDLVEVKRAAKSRGVSVTDFVMASVSGGLRRLFEARGELLEADLVAFVPISVRREGAEGEMGNQCGVLQGLRATTAGKECPALNELGQRRRPDGRIGGRSLARCTAALRTPTTGGEPHRFVSSGTSDSTLAEWSSGPYSGATRAPDGRTGAERYRHLVLRKPGVWAVGLCPQGA